MAKRGAERLESPTDGDFHNVFKRIFKVDKRDSTKHNLKYLLKDKTAYELVHGMPLSSAISAFEMALINHTRYLKKYWLRLE